MPTTDCVIALFCVVDERLTERLTERLGAVPRHPQARLWPSEAVTVGLLYALKGGSFRAFERWLRRDLAPLFGAGPARGLPERTRLLRLLRRHRPLADVFLASWPIRRSSRSSTRTASSCCTPGATAGVPRRWARRAGLITAGSWA